MPDPRNKPASRAADRTRPGEPATGTDRKRLVVGVTGASGAIFAQRLIQLLVAGGHEVHLVVTAYGRRLLHDELGMQTLDVHALAGLDPSADPRAHGVYVHPHKDVGATIASGSFRHDGMIVMPCSSNTLGAIAAGVSNELLTRAAQVALKERLPLVLCHRESPLSLIDIENMRRVTLAGAIVAPINPGYYLQPRCIGDLVDFVVGRTLDLVGVRHTLPIRWGESGPADAAARPPE
jgi:4-hydroxy-3-polyprenylbenzoate decarboxylase